MSSIRARAADETGSSGQHLLLDAVTQNRQGMMSGVLSEIEALESRSQLGIYLLAVADRDRLRGRIRVLYGGQRPPIWETVADCTSIQNRDGWEWISEFVGPRPCILLFDTSEEMQMFRVPSGEALGVLLANTHGFEFYVTDEDAGYLICFNHHDMLICCGSAKPWMETRMDP